MIRRNKPLNAQQPPPAFANDPSGFFGAILADNAAAGIGSLLPAGTVFQSDVTVKARLLAGQIRWTPAIARWKGCNLVVSLSDAQFMLELENGGDSQKGQVSILVLKTEFNAGAWPDYGDTVQLQAAAQWHEFLVVEMLGQHDDNDPGLTLVLDKEQNDNGI